MVASTGGRLEPALTFYPIAWKSQQQGPSKTNVVSFIISFFQTDVPLPFLEMSLFHIKCSLECLLEIMLNMLAKENVEIE